jgi:peptidoglycan/LPS O-acetylase OafA/YrhL
LIRVVATVLRLVASVPPALPGSGGVVVSTRFWIPSLDGIRAVAFLLVFVSHTDPKRAFPGGGFGVTLFFFLSGYLITTLLRMEAEKTGRVSLRSFYLRRVLRIFPPFYFVLGTVTLLVALGVVGPRFHPYTAFALYTHWYNYFGITYMQTHYVLDMPPGLGIYWSLAVEEHFYLAFAPAYALLWWRLDRASLAKVLLLVCALVLAWRCVLVYGWHVPSYRCYLATDTRIDSILFGCLLGVWKNPVLDRYETGWRFNWLLLPLAFGVLLFTLLIRAEAFREAFRYTIQGLALFPVFIAAVRYPGSVLFRPLNRGWVRHVGTLSYTLYLCHNVILDEVSARLGRGPVLAGVVSLLASLVFAEVVYRLIEKPANRLRQRLSRVEGPGPAARTARPPAGPVTEVGEQSAVEPRPV